MSEHNLNCPLCGLPIREASVEDAQAVMEAHVMADHPNWEKTGVGTYSKRKDAPEEEHEEKLSITVEPHNDAYVVACSWDGYMQMFPTHPQAMWEGERHFRAAHPEEVAKRDAKLAAASAERSPTARQWKNSMRQARRRKK